MPMCPSHIHAVQIVPLTSETHCIDEGICRLCQGHSSHTVREVLFSVPMPRQVKGYTSEPPHEAPRDGEACMGVEPVGMEQEQEGPRATEIMMSYDHVVEHCREKPITCMQCATLMMYILYFPLRNATRNTASTSFAR